MYLTSVFLMDNIKIFWCVSAFICACLSAPIQSFCHMSNFAGLSALSFLSSFAFHFFSSLLDVRSQDTPHAYSSLRTWCRRWGRTSGSASSASRAASVAPQRTTYVWFRARKAWMIQLLCLNLTEVHLHWCFFSQQYKGKINFINRTLKQITIHHNRQCNKGG